MMVFLSHLQQGGVLRIDRAKGLEGTGCVYFRGFCLRITEI